MTASRQDGAKQGRRGARPSRRQVAAGRFPPGQRVPTEEELVRKLGISRPSVREGLKALARKGLVESRARRGTVVLERDAGTSSIPTSCAGWRRPRPITPS